MHVSLLIDADGTIEGFEHDAAQVSALRVQPFPTGAFDVAMLLACEPSDPVVSVQGRAGAATVEGMWHNYSPESRDYPVLYTVRVNASGGFRMDIAF